MQHIIGVIAIIAVYLLEVFYFITFDISQWSNEGRLIATILMPFVYMAVISFHDLKIK